LKKIARIKDIAKRANVSAGTVDRVLHNRGRVSPQAKDRVLKAMEELNYEPNVMARALVSSGECRIAALIPNPSKDEYWEAPFRGVDQAEEQMRQYGVIVDKYLFNQEDSESFKREALRISDLKYKGILVAPIFYRESLSFLSKWSKEGIPFNLFNTHIPDYKPVSYVGQDSYQSGVLAGKLLHYGAKSPGTFLILHIEKEVANSTHLIKKEQGFIDYFEDYKGGGINIIHSEIDSWENEDRCDMMLDELMNRISDLRGFFVTNSRSYVVGNYLKKRGIKGLQLVGYDLLTSNLALLDEGIINFLINQNPRGQGYLGVKLLVDHLVFGQKVDPIKYLPLDIVTKENVQYYI
jgi:LacI family transcriptional regulator